MYKYPVLEHYAQGKNGVIYALKKPGWTVNSTTVFLRNPHNLAEGRADFKSYKALVDSLHEYEYANYRDEFGDDTFRYEKFGKHGSAIGHNLMHPGVFRLYSYRWNPNTLILLEGAVKKMGINESATNNDSTLGPLLQSFTVLIDKVICGIAEGDFEDRPGKPGFYKPGDQEPLQLIELIR